jgi:5-methylcytosine-specific restriction endonuclease McrA
MCAAEFTGRKDKTLCSVECKRQAKRTYDRERYPEISAATNARACAWQRANADRKRAYDAAYRESTRDRRQEQSRIWDAEHRRLHPEDGRFRQHRRRARKAANGVFAVTDRDYARLLVLYGDCCAYCRGAFDSTNPLEWDHVVPIARGGSHSVGNIVPSCRRCNRNKSKRFVSEWRAGKVVSGVSGPHS